MVNNEIVKIDKNEPFINLSRLKLLYKKNLKWFFCSILICIVFAGLFIWFTPTTISVVGKMEIIDKSKNNSSGMSAGMALLNSLPMNLGSNLGATSLGIDSEIEILKSNSLVRNVVEDLGIYTEYRQSKWGRNTLLYQNTPITVSLDSTHLKWFDDELPLTSHQIQLTVSKNSNGYKVKTRLIENKEKTKLPTQTFATLPATIETEAGTLTITENILSPKQAKAYEKGYTLKITVSPPSSVADNFITRLNAEPPTKTVTNILNITLRDENMMRGIDFIDYLVKAYNQRANEVKNEEARNTDEFVSTRLAKIDVELGSSDDDWENSKKQYQITSLQVDAEEALTKKSQYEMQLVSIETNLQLHDYLSDYINDPKNLYELIPIGVMGGSNEGQTTAGATRTSSFISQHNSLVNQRKDLLKSVSEMSPQVQRLSESIRELHPIIVLAMKRDREQLVMQKNTLDREYARYSGRVGSVPQVERVFTDISRQREIKQAVYLLLLQKREETAMELANITDKGRLIDIIKVAAGSIKPQKKMVLLLALFLGVLFPMGVLSLLQMFKTKIETREDLEPSSKLPFLAEIPISNIEEAIRNLRTSLLLYLKLGQKTILVASQNDGDGKTFIAQHLADSLNSIGKKTLYVNTDLRGNNSQLSIGSAQFCHDSAKHASMKALAAPESLNSQFDKGHPADILASEEFAKQIATAKEANDYVILDSPAYSQYADALQLAQFADATIYIAKAGVTTKSDVEKLQADNRLPQPMLVLNAIK